MTLERNDDGSHTFKPPLSPYIGSQDPQGRTAQVGALVTRPIGPPHATPPQVVKNHGMQGYELVAFQMEFYDSRGTWQQEGPLSDVHSGYAENEMVGDAPYVMRHPFIVKEYNAASGDWVPPTSLSTFLERLSWAYFAGKLFFTIGVDATGVADPPVVWGETSATNPIPAKVATYTPTANHTQIMCMAVITTGGATRLWIGYLNGAGAAAGIDTFAGATLTPAVVVDPSNGHTGGYTDAVCGILQAPTGDILICTGQGDIRLCTNNTAAPAALSFTTMQAQALGYFPVAIGNLALSNYSPSALFWAPLDNSGLWFANNNVQSADQTPKGKLVFCTYDGLTLSPLDFPDLPYVSFATIYRGGCAACDRKSHYWYTGSAMRSMDGGSDRSVDSHKQRLCCGHTVVGDKLVRVEAEVDDRFVAATPNSTYNTFARLIEYDPYLGRERPICKPVDMGFGGQSIMVGASPSFPFSPNTRNIHWFGIWEGLMATRNQDFGHWWRQYQAQNSNRGYAERSTDVGNAGGAAGFEGFEDDVTYLSAEFTHPALQGFEYTAIRAITPRVESLQQGGIDANIDVTVGGYTANLSAAEPSDRYPSAPLGDWPASRRSWYTSLQLEVVSHLGTGVTHKTGTVWPLTLEVLARRPLQDGIRL